ncbi:DUF6233 domain-containing protein [Streptomyces sp. NPDC050856]|uniref:DUF6233 domain-containing protein n=1 Tax=Streptomyces sp. NPDC050856 TaxID=3154939 RepID=UPI0033D7F9DC
MSDSLPDLPPDLPRLETLATWLRYTLGRVEARIAEVRQAEAARARRVPPPGPDYRIQRGLSAERAPVRVHLGDCGMAQKAPGCTQDIARQALAQGVEACAVCRPDTQLGVLD